MNAISTRRFLQTTGLLIAGVVLAACSKTEPPPPPAAAPVASAPAPAPAKVYAVGTDAAYAPFESQNEKGEIVGFDIDVLTAVAKKAGIEVKFVNTPWEGIFNNLAQGDRDIIVSAVTITDERKQTMDFSNPYFDAQQLMAIRRMCLDFNIPVEVVAVPTVREADGLALSSRNRFLGRGDRKRALALSEALLACVERAKRGDAPDSVLAAGYDVLARADGVVLDYLAVVDPASCEPVPNDYRGEVVIAVAAKVGATRLIDNMPATIKGGRR